MVSIVSERPVASPRLSAMLIEQIRECHTKEREDLDAKFSELNLLSRMDKADALLKAMGIGKNDQVFYSGSPEGVDVEEDQYEALVGAFLSGAWK